MSEAGSSVRSREVSFESEVKIGERVDRASKRADERECEVSRVEWVVRVEVRVGSRPD